MINMSTVQGVQEPRILHVPANVVGSLGEEAVDLAKTCGLILDEWQEMLLHYSLAIREDTYYNKYTKWIENKWAAYEMAAIIARQNGKGSFLEARELAGMFLLGEKFIVHSAHQHDTSQEAHTRLLELIDGNTELSKKILRAPTGHGEQGLELRSGQRMRFRTRTAGGGRGFTADLVVFDEAMYLDGKFVSALMPTLSARPNGQIIYTGSAGTLQSTQLGRLRRRGLSSTEEDPRLFFAEWSGEICDMFCPEDGSCEIHMKRNDPRLWAMANPGMGNRILEETIAAEYLSMEEEEFNRERLSIGTYPVDGEGWTVIPKPRWFMAQSEESMLDGKFSLGISTSPDNSMSSIGIAGAATGLDIADGWSEKTIHVEVSSTEEEYDWRPGVGWVVDRVKELSRTGIIRPGDVQHVVIDKVAQAGQFIDELENAGIKVISPTAREYGQACGEFVTGIVPRKGDKRSIVHIGQAMLDNAVAVAITRPLTDMFAWSKRNSAADISPLDAVTLARWGYKKHIYGKADFAWAYEEEL